MQKFEPFPKNPAISKVFRAILATALDHELVAKFAKEFMELYNGIDF